MVSWSAPAISKPGAVAMLMAVRRYQQVEADDEAGGGCRLAWLSEDVLVLIGHWVVYQHLGFEGCCRHGCLATLVYVGESAVAGTRVSDAEVRLALGASGCPGVIKHLVENHSAGVDTPQAREALCRACREGTLETVQYLVGKGACVDTNEGALIQSASCFGHTSIVRCLVEHGASIVLGHESALEHACDGGHLETAEYLLGQGADASFQDDSPLRSASASGHLDVVACLVRHGADINSFHGEALQRACGNGHADVARFLIQHGADVTAGGNDAVAWAAENGDVGIVRLLLGHGAADSEKILSIACEGGHSALVAFLLSDIAFRSDALGEALVRASRRGHTAIVQQLVECGAPINNALPGSTALYHAMMEGRLDIVRFLVEKGAVVPGPKTLRGCRHPQVLEYLRGAAGS